MIKWNEEHSVGISIIDEEHKRFFYIIDEIIVTKQHDYESEKIEKILNELIDYAWNHFRTEESYMIEFKYSEYQYHKEEHFSFVHRINSYSRRVSSGDFQIANEILEFLKEWLIKHILITDMKYVECFARNGLK